MADSAYQHGINEIMKGNLDLDGDTFEALLISDAYTFGAAHEDEADLSGVLARVDLAGLSVDTSGVWDATSPLTFSSVAGGSTAAAVVFQKKTGVAANNTLVAYFDNITNFPRATDGGDIVVDLPSSGILQIAA